MPPSLTSDTEEMKAKDTIASDKPRPTLWHDGGLCPRKRMKGLQFARAVDHGKAVYRVTDATGGGRRTYSYTDRRAAVKAYDALAKEKGKAPAVIVPTIEESKALEMWRAWKECKDAAPSLIDAMQATLARLEGYMAGRLSIAAGVRLYIDDMRRRHVTAHHVTTTSTLLWRIAAVMPLDTPLESITIDDAASDRASIYEDGMSLRTQQALANAAGAMWRYLTMTGRISSPSPWQAAHKRTASHDARRRPAKEYTDAASLRSMLAWTLEHHADMVPALALAAFCGLRPSELHRLTWENVIVDAAESAVIIGGVDVKSDASARKIAMPAAAAAWIAAAMPHGMPSTGHVIARASEITRAAAWHRLIDGIKTACPPVIISPAAAPAAAWTRDLLRHSYGTYTLAMTNNLDATAAAMGNTPAVCRAHYTQQVRRSEAAAWFSVMP